MKLVRTVLVAFSIASASIALNTGAIAKDFKAGEIMIKAPWAKATPKGAKVAGGYLKLMNMGKEDDQLISGVFSKSGKTEIHEMSMKKGIMMMKQLQKGLTIKAGETVELKPGSFHMMFLDLKEQLKTGDTVKGVLVFEKAGKVEIEYEVRDLAGKKSSARGSHDGHGMKH